VVCTSMLCNWNVCHVCRSNRYRGKMHTAGWMEIVDGRRGGGEGVRDGILDDFFLGSLGLLFACLLACCILFLLFEEGAE